MLILCNIHNGITERKVVSHERDLDAYVFGEHLGRCTNPRPLLSPSDSERNRVHSRGETHEQEKDATATAARPTASPAARPVAKASNKTSKNKSNGKSKKK
ncbi:hypothetical protein BGZ65_012815, partial [Modicella reniformis]